MRDESSKYFICKDMIDIKQRTICITLCATLTSLNAHAEALPNAADIAHTKTILDSSLVKKSAATVSLPDISAGDTTAPEGAKDIRIRLDSLIINGSTVFSQEELKQDYSGYLGAYIKLSDLWVIADRITKRYKDNGYFLSRVFVPKQEVKQGHIVLQAVEGYVSTFKLDPALQNNMLAMSIARNTEQKKPLKIRELERAILQINDVSGKTYQATLYALDKAESGSVGLVISPSTTPQLRGSWIVNNYGSRYTGPYQNTLLYNDNIIKNHTTQIAMQTTIPVQESKYLALKHDIPLTAEDSLSLFTSYITSKPGFTLKPQKIESNAFELNAELRHNIIRQLNKNLSLMTQLAHKIIDTNILSDTDLSHDSLYYLRTGLQGDYTDKFGGKSDASLTYTRGLSILDANEKTSLSSSRSLAKPDFNKLEFDAQRQQSLNDDFVANFRVVGQYSTDTLYSSEEFGFGGQNLGRSFDASEFSGQRGVAGSAEIYYYGLMKAEDIISPIPYAFYDIATISNPNNDPKHTQASSVGFGTKLNLPSNSSASFSFAWPMGQDISTPTYGSNRAPRFLLQIGHNF